MNEKSEKQKLNDSTILYENSDQLYVGMKYNWSESYLTRLNL